MNETIEPPPIGLGGNEQQQRALAEGLGMEIALDLSHCHFPREALKKVGYSFVKKQLVLPIGQENDVVVVAVADPLNASAMQDISLLLGSEIKAVYSPKEAIQVAINECYNQQEGATSELLADLEGTRDSLTADADVAVYDLLDDSPGQPPVIKLLNFILTEAIQQRASDIHFESEDTGLRVRYRIDGVLQTRHHLSQEYRAQLITRGKVMAKMDIAEHRLPQDGRIKVVMGRREIDFRVSTVPVSEGERIVMRILDRSNVILGLDKLGMTKDMLSSFRKLLDIPEGILLVTGPTGSGKTTTLYSAICSIVSEESNIMTIEDPVEYNLKGIAQIGVQPKIQLDFARGLRHILRQDPDIIMIGEIRDAETAEIAVQAALTGHLVLATLHTNDAPSAVTRLVDMGIEPYLLSSSLVGILAQRLVRRICRSCKEQYIPSNDELASVGLTKDDIKGDGKLWRGKGCPNCFNTGFQGRHGIYELLVVDNAFKKQIVVSPDAVELRNVARDNGMKSLLDHGAVLVLHGVTTIDEVLRATRAIDIR